MLPIEPQQCSLTAQLTSMLIGGFAGSIGFIVNILVVGSIVRWWAARKQQPDFEAARRTAAAILKKTHDQP